VRFGLFADGLFVIAAPPEHAAALGKPVESINGHDWRKLRRELAAYQGGPQSFRDQLLPYFLEIPAVLAAAGFGSTDERMLIGLKDGRTLNVAAALAPLQGEQGFLGESQLRMAAPLVQGKRPDYLQRPGNLYDFVSMPEIAAAYFVWTPSR
jgi:hypothetical protein